ncbi:hypothetical protein [Quadrisphaera sp. DSM 44207]|uniref:type IV toxin-antitoxin system AbiEi family antitoxin domain-containing protein n=1 Tax=Quadrisphaera sp. DSM 44207 TaxID=1881057 RepID=UPI0008830A8B|nr:hypothetical protein [Quadrisphaera sp. DSM 44207]SDQ74146.1 Transcriptional regulator, AbiEi antitoxin, Type IV TA system [Quadrisphaera sp. DSM 44207]
MELPLVFTTAEALEAGWTRHEVTGRVRRGDWVRLRSGAFCLAERWRASDASGRHVLGAVAVARCRDGAVLSHLSAAARWGWPLPPGGDQPSWLTTAPGPATRTVRLERLRVEVADLGAPEVVPAVAARVSVTSRARTVADCLRHLPAPDAVAVADAAVAAGLSRADLDEAPRRQTGWPYAERARGRVRLVDPRRESWLESWSVVRLHERGVPLPEPQAVVHDRRGRFLARVDWWWPQHGVVGEADGRVKYRRAGIRTPEDADRLLREEKGREDRLRDAGLEVVRYGTRDADGGIEELLDRVGRALARGDPARVHGRITPTPLPRWW